VSPCGLLLCDDLIFVSRIAGAAKSLGFFLRSVKNPAELLSLARQILPRCVILDLHIADLHIEELIQALSALETKPFVVGYGSHVDTETLKKARTAGCDLVWPRSKFVEELTTALPQWFREAERNT
jgi:ActR/RegA family two-component response regulator